MQSFTFRPCLASSLIAAAWLAGACAMQAHAAGVVGTGTSASCTEGALDTALGGGGNVTFNCGGSATIVLTLQKAITQATNIDGGNNVITLDANNASRHFSVSNGANLSLHNLNLSNGNANGNAQIPAGDGGAIYTVGPLTLTLDGVGLYNNQAAKPMGYGGAIATFNGATVNLTRVRADGNQAGYGGAIATHGPDTLSLTDFVATSNQSVNGGGAVQHWGTALTVTRSLFASNSVTGNGAGGGAIELNILTTTSLDISNSTFHDNGGNSATGGALSMENVVNGTINNVTFAANRAQETISMYGSGTNTVTMRNSIVVSAPTVENCRINASSTLTDGGNNLQFGGKVAKACGASIAEADPMLAALTYNTGFSDTMALLPGSPAIDGGNDATCKAEDQRTVARPLGAHCDIGAFEAPAAAVAPAITNGPPPNGTVGIAYHFAYAATGTAPIAFNVTSGSLPPGLTLSSAGVISGTPTAFGNYSATVTAGNGTAPDAMQQFTISIAASTQQPPAATASAPSLGVCGMLSMIALLALAAVPRRAMAARKQRQPH